MRVLKQVLMSKLRVWRSKLIHCFIVFYGKSTYFLEQAAGLLLLGLSIIRHSTRKLCSVPENRLTQEQGIRLVSVHTANPFKLSSRKTETKTIFLQTVMPSGAPDGIGTQQMLIDL